MKDKVELIHVDNIRVLNPRHRDKRKFEQIVASIKSLGLKKPIKVSRRHVKNASDPEFDLVCGQGRIEAFRTLGYIEIPAIIVDVPKEDCLLMSLVENMARRFPNPMDLIHEIERLKALGYSNVAVGKKLGMADSFVGNLLTLRNAGEERLLDAAMKGKIPLGVAIDIAKAEGREAQLALMKAYDSRQLNQISIRMVKKVINQRQFFGKGLGRQNGGSTEGKPTAASLVNAYKKESQRQKTMVKKARICEAKLLFIKTAFKRLLSSEDFRNLLRAESLDTVPTFLADAATSPS